MLKVPSEPLITHQRVAVTYTTSVYAWYWMYLDLVTLHSELTTLSLFAHLPLRKHFCHVETFAFANDP